MLIKYKKNILKYNNLFIIMNSLSLPFKKGLLIGTLFGTSFTFFIQKKYIDKNYLLTPKNIYVKEPYTKIDDNERFE